MLGLEGDEPQTVDVDAVESRLKQIRDSGTLNLLGIRGMVFHEKQHLVMHKRQNLPYHPNGMRFTAFDPSGKSLLEKIYYSVGGGFIVDETAAGADRVIQDPTVVSHAFTSAKELLSLCDTEGLCISTLMLENEKAWRGEQEIREELKGIWQVMQACVERGCHREGILPGGMKVKRRAAGM